MKIKIINKKKFMKLPVMILSILCICIILLTDQSESNTEITYKTIYVSKGETLWDIATKEAEKNEYYKGYDVRDIIQEIEEMNGLLNANIFEGKELKIPSM